MTKKRIEKVSIPSNRGNHSNDGEENAVQEGAIRSQSPRIGAIIRMQGTLRGHHHPPEVSIPSNRGNHSNQNKPSGQGER